jgi:hypothetical protein
LGLPTDCREPILAITQEAPSRAKCLSEVATEDLQFRRESRPLFGEIVVWILVVGLQVRL